MRAGISIADEPNDIVLPDESSMACTSLRMYVAAAFYDKRLEGGRGFRVHIKNQVVTPFSKTRDIRHAKETVSTLRGDGSNALTIRWTIGWSMEEAAGSAENCAATPFGFPRKTDGGSALVCRGDSGRRWCRCGCSRGRLGEARTEHVP